MEKISLQDKSFRVVYGLLKFLRCKFMERKYFPSHMYSDWSLMGLRVFGGMGRDSDLASVGWQGRFYLLTYAFSTRADYFWEGVLLHDAPLSAVNEWSLWKRNDTRVLLLFGEEGGSVQTLWGCSAWVLRLYLAHLCNLGPSLSWPWKDWAAACSTHIINSGGQNNDLFLFSHRAPIQGDLTDVIFSEAWAELRVQAM